MRTPKRLVLVNWSLYNHIVIDLGDINFITGNTGSGKSTIADAIQLILFGDTKGSYFNKAGDDNSNRRLIDYLYADKGIDNLRRQAPFISFVLFEFERIDGVGKKSYFTLAYQANIEDDDVKTPPNTWFVLEDRIPHVFLNPESVPQSRDALRRIWLECYGEEYKNKIQELNSNSDYLKKIKDPLYLNIRDEYIRSLKKAVSFEKINKMDTFIADYLCQNVKKPDFNKMKIVYDELSRLSAEVAEKDKKRVLLDNILSSYDKFEEYTRILVCADYVTNKANLNLLRNANEKLFSELKLAKDECSAINNSLEVVSEKAKEIDAALFQNVIKRSENNEGIRRDRLQEELRRLQLDVEYRRDKKERILSGFISLQKRWIDIVEQSQTLDKEYWIKDSNFSCLYDLSRLNGDMSDFFLLENIVKNFSSIKNNIAVSKNNAENKVDILNSEINEDQKKITKLKNGLGNYPEEVVAFVEYLKSEGGIKARYLSDCLEIDMDDWADAVEAVLDINRYALLVDTDDFKKTEELLRKYPLKKDEIRVFDIDFLYKTMPDSDTSSLAEVLYSEDQDANYAIRKLLGDIPRDNNLNKFLLYKDGILKKIPESSYKYKMIGKKAKENNIKSFEDAIDEKRTLIEKQKRAISFFNSIENTPGLEFTQVENYKEIIESCKEIPALQGKIQEYAEELDTLDLSVIEELDAEKKRLEKELSDMREKERELYSKKGAAESKYKELSGNSSESAQKIAELDARLDSDPFKIDGEKLYIELSLNLNDKNLSNYNESYEAQNAKTRKNNAYVEIKLNQERYKDLSKNSLLDEKSINRKAWEEESSLLGDNELKAYHDRLIEKTDEAYKLLMDEVITKMGASIKSARASLRQYTNQIKDITFSGYKYEFKAEKKLSPEFSDLYDLFLSSIYRNTSSDGQGDIFFDSWREDHKESIEQLERLLGLRDANPSKNYQSEIDRYTDYRNYLDFDLIKYREDEPDKILSYNKAGKRGSGGEMQIDTYIPVVTAVYSSSRDGVNFIMLDEAFSKVTGEYVKNAIELLKEFKMRAILLAPTGRIEEFSESCNKTFIIEKQNIGGRDIAFSCPYE